MASSQLFGGTEECSSTESGWTMYIASPTHDDDDDHSDEEEDAYDDGNDDNEDDDDHKKDDDDDDDDDSDDSMASDASSGPCHQKNPCGFIKSKYCQHKKKVIRNMGTKGDDDEERKINLDMKEGPAVVAKSIASSAPSGAKARKPKWMSKGK